jgi:hypothetical protein
MQQEQRDVLNSIDLPEKISLGDYSIEDSRLLSELPAGFKPIKEIPSDDLVDVYYEQKFEARCTLCKSPFKTLAEHVYLNNGWKPHAVMAFFKEYFNARVSWDCVDAHMKRHCDFSKLGASGLKKLALRQDNMFLWQYREMDLAISGILDEIDEIKGMNVEKRPDLKMKQATLLRTLYRDLVDVTQKRDEASTGTINIQKLLMEIWAEMPNEESKAVIIKKVQAIQKVLND